MFMTDEARRTYYSIDIASQAGSEILLKKNHMYAYEVAISIHDHSQKKDQANCEALKHFNYSQCFEVVIASDVEPPIFGCIPPWMSNKNQCQETKVPFSMHPNSSCQKFAFNYGIPFSYNHKTKAELKCRQHCVKQMINVMKRSQAPTKGKKRIYCIHKL